MVLRPPWFAIDDPDVARLFEEELARELATGTAFDGVPRLIAHRQDRDDCLFEVGSGGWAIVHLTWSQADESDARWPRLEMFGSLDALTERLELDASDLDA